jgi:polysaccharide export outer membrane protein
MSSKLKAIGAILIGMLAVHSGAFSQATPASPPGTGAISTADPAAASQGPVASVVGVDYVIGPGDVIQVHVWREPDMSMTVPVLPDGKISTPGVTDMVAVGKTSSQLAKDIAERLSERVRFPEVTVTVTQALSAFSQVKVIGQVQRQEALAYREGMTVLDALLAAGGLTEFAAGNRAKLLRTENGKQKEIRIRIGRLYDGDMSQNHKLKPGDVLLIPESRW